jgi:TPR repeat protein
LKPDQRHFWRSKSRRNEAESATIYDGIDAYQRHNFGKAFRLLRSSARSGVPEAQYIVGSIIEVGLGGTACDPAMAGELYRSSARQGCPYAEANTLTYMLNEEYVSFGYAEGAEWEWLAGQAENLACRLHERSLRGDVEAAISLKHLQADVCSETPYFGDVPELLLGFAMNGYGDAALFYGIDRISRDLPGLGDLDDMPPEIVAWLRFALKQGFHLAGSVLGSLFIQSRNEDRAREGWDMLEAATQGHDLPAATMLAHALERTANDPHSRLLAASWYRRLAEQGGAKEKFEAALRHHPTSDQCLEPDSTLALELFEEAASLGHPSAKMMQYAEAGAAAILH